MAAVVTAMEAVLKIRDGATVLVNPVPSEEVFCAFERAFLEQGRPCDLTMVWAAGLGPFSAERLGMNHFAHAGMTKRVIAGHVGLNYEMVKLIASEQCEAYNLPQGVLTQLYREIAAHRPGLVTHVGLGTFVDPRNGGGRLNERTRACEDLCEVLTIGGQEKLFYRSFPVNVGVIRGTTADARGNISSEDEALLMEPLEVAMAAKNNGGIVIAQVERLSDAPLLPHDVTVPGLFVDYVVVASSRQMHPSTLFVEYESSYTGATRVSLDQELKPLSLNTEKIICRRAALELQGGMSVNLGVGIPMGVASVACEEGLLDGLTMSTEVGCVGGLPEGGKNFGPAKNLDAFLSQPAMFDYYDGGGLDITCLGMAQVGRDGSVNVSRIGNRIIGCGGFINITQSTHKCLFCGEFTAGGAQFAVENGKLRIVQEGKVRKFVDKVEQITFNGPIANSWGQEILYITERCVFQLTPEGMVLREVAPGIDITNDIVDQMGFKPIIPSFVPLMPSEIFHDTPMRIADHSKECKRSACVAYSAPV